MTRAFMEGPRVELRPIEEDDLPFLQRNHNDPEVRHYYRRVDPQNADQLEDDYESYMCDEDSTNCIAWVDDDRVGAFSVHHIDYPRASGWLTAMVDPAYHGEGYAPEATALVVDHAFTDRGLNRVRAAVYEPNRPSHRVVEKLGFTEEVVLRDEEYVDGEYVDSHHYGLLREEWPGLDEVLDVEAWES